jgi:membrane fusion protein (multidrug efflux system)
MTLIRARELAWRFALLGVAVAILTVVATRWTRWEGRSGWQVTDDAYLQADITPISSKVAGYVSSLSAEDFELVQAGQLVATLVDDDFRALVAQAQAALAAARAQAQGLSAQEVLQRSNIRAARSVVTGTAASVEQNTRDLARQQRLLRSGSSSTEATEKLGTLQLQLEAQLAQNRAQADSASQQLSVIAAQALQARAAIEAQEASLRLAQINLGYTRILAPEAGVLGLRQVRAGQYLAVGSQITTLTALPHVWVIANFKETQLRHMAAGQRSEVQVDSFPNRVLHGHVLAFSPASGSQFSLLPPDNATGNFTKVVQRIAVKISVEDSGELIDRLRPGMSVIAKIDAVAR